MSDLAAEGDHLHAIRSDLVQYGRAPTPTDTLWLLDRIAAANEQRDTYRDLYDLACHDLNAKIDAALRERDEWLRLYDEANQQRADALRERDAIATRALEKVARAHELYDRAEARADALRARCAAAEAQLKRIEHYLGYAPEATGEQLYERVAHLVTIAHAAAVEAHRE